LSADINVGIQQKKKSAPLPEDKLLALLSANEQALSINSNSFP
jgi:hypothetical protein